MNSTNNDEMYYLNGPDEFVNPNESTSAPVEKEAPTWYTENEMYQWLIRENYSEQIAKELSGKYANYLQGAFNKGFEKGSRENARLRSLIEKYNEGIKKYVFHHDKFFQSPKVGQPPSLQPLRELIKDYDVAWEQFKKDNNL